MTPNKKPITAKYMSANGYSQMNVEDKRLYEIDQNFKHHPTKAYILKQPISGDTPKESLTLDEAAESEASEHATTNGEFEEFESVFKAGATYQHEKTVANAVKILEAAYYGLDDINMADLIAEVKQLKA